jgi:hypothetical protein
MILEVYNLFNDHAFKVNDVVKITFLYKESMYSKSIDSLINIPENQIAREHIWCHINNVSENHLIIEIANPCFYSKNKNKKTLQPGDVLRIHKKYVKVYKEYMSMEYIPSLPDLCDINVSPEQNAQFKELKHKLELFREASNIQLTQKKS